MIGFLRGVFTPLFLACLLVAHIGDGNQGWVAWVYYAIAGVLFIADIIDCYWEK